MDLNTLWLYEVKAKAFIVDIKLTKNYELLIIQPRFMYESCFFISVLRGEM
jgi:hypothetical protein